MAELEQPVSLLDLPGACLLTVLRCLAASGDQRSLLSAARAHSRLHQVAAVALCSLTVKKIEKQQQVDEVLLYLSKHSQHVSTLCLQSDGVPVDFFDDTGDSDEFRYAATLRQLPSALQLHSLELDSLRVQLQPGGGCPGIVGYAGVSALKQLRLDHCMLLDGDDGLAVTLQQLAPGLKHLRLSGLLQNDQQDTPTQETLSDSANESDASDQLGASDQDPLDVGDEDASSYDGYVSCPSSVLQQMRQLTCLDLDTLFVDPDQQEGHALQPLQALTSLVALRLAIDNRDVITANLLSGMCRLTRLQLSNHRVERAVLAGRTQLQHLALWSQGCVHDDPAWMAQLLSQLQPLLQLTCLCLDGGLALRNNAIPAVAYSALTASSKLQHLYIGSCTLPEDVWQHVFPFDRQLPHLTSLQLYRVEHPGCRGIQPPAALEGSRLVSCCPGLRLLNVRDLSYSAGALAPLQELSALRTLLVHPNRYAIGHGVCTAEGLGEVTLLTGLRELDMRPADECLLLQLTRLKQLTKLEYLGCTPAGGHTNLSLTAKTPHDHPVWLQVGLYLQYEHKNHS